MSHNFSWNSTKHDKPNTLFSQLLSEGTLKADNYQDGTKITDKNTL
jgi:hypothetical protein